MVMRPAEYRRFPPILRVCLELTAVSKAPHSLEELDSLTILVQCARITRALTRDDI